VAIATDGNAPAMPATTATPQSTAEYRQPPLERMFTSDVGAGGSGGLFNATPDDYIV